MERSNFIQRHKTAARVALYSLPVLFLAVFLGARFYNQQEDAAWDWMSIDFESYESVQLFQEYLRIDTSYPEGSELPGAEFLARQLAEVGIEAQIETIDGRYANLWAILEGEDPRALVLHNHIDVDPVKDPEEWLHDPFSGLVDPPWIYGRGAFDMKSVTIAQLMAVKELVRKDVPLKRSLIFLATADEERESWFGTRWLLRHHPELVERFDAVLTEGGAIEAITLDDVKYWGTEFMQKRFIELRICHQSYEALDALREGLQEFWALRLLAQGKPQISDDVWQFLELYGTTREHRDFQLALKSRDSLLQHPDFVRMPKNIQAMVRNEIYAWTVERNPEGGWFLRTNLHLLPHTSVEDAFAELLPRGLPGFAVSVDVPHSINQPSSLQHPVYRALDDYMKERFPDIVHGPLCVPWSATDARFFRNAGIPTWGYSPFVIVSSDTAKMSGPNERMAAPAFIDGVETYVGLVERLVSLSPEPAPSP